MKYYLLILIFAAGLWNAQVINRTDSNRLGQKDTLVVISGKKDSLKIFKPTIQDYLWQTQFSEKKVFDTVLTADKTYYFTQSNNTDNFGRIPFANVGSGYQQLYFSVNPEANLALMPTNKSYNIMGIADVKYYDVKTPTTTFIYHNAVKNGGTLYSTYTQNVGKNFNFAVQYFGLHSQGAYQNSLAANNNILFSAHYLSPKKHYEFFAHYTAANFNNQEYGGIQDLDNFTSGDSRFKNRQNLAVNLQYSNSRFAYRRYYFSQEYTPLDPEKIPFKIRHTFFWQGNKYYFSETSPETVYGTDFVDYPLGAKKFSTNLSNTVSLAFDKAKFKFDAGVRYQMISLGVGQGLAQGNISIPDKLSENRLGAVGHLSMRVWDRIALNSELEVSRGSRFGSFIRSQNLLDFQPFKDYSVSAHVNFQSAVPSFNYLINASPYTSFNYYWDNPKNQTVTQIGGVVRIPFFDVRAFADFYRVDNFAYFTAAGTPAQATSSMNISQIGGEGNFSYGHFHLNPKVQFQAVLTQKNLMPLPNFLGRVNVYWQSKVFNKAAELQAGMKLYYFSKFASRDYFPVLNEFILPDANSYSIGGQPIADIYVNMKVKKMFFFVEAQHLDTTFLRNKSFTAPYYPLYDFRLNIGIVWYLFS